MIEFKQVAKEFINGSNRIQALNQVSLNIQYREIFGLVGESGAGKSTLLRFINALEKPSSGQVLVADVLVCFAIEKYIVLQRKIHIVATQ